MLLNKIINFVKYQLLTLLWAIFIYILCLSNPSAFPKHHLFNIPYFDKWVHAFLFGVMALLFLLGYKRQKPRLLFTFKHYSIVLLICTVYGAFIEGIQHYCTTTRQADGFDIVADFTGALLACLTAYFWLIKSKN